MVLLKIDWQEGLEGVLIDGESKTFDRFQKETSPQKIPAEIIRYIKHNYLNPEPVLLKAIEEIDFEKIAQNATQHANTAMTKFSLESIVFASHENRKRCKIQKDRISLICGCELKFDRTTKRCERHKYSSSIELINQIIINGIYAFAISSQVENDSPVVHIRFLKLNSGYIIDRYIPLYIGKYGHVVLYPCGCIFLQNGPREEIIMSRHKHPEMMVEQETRKKVIAEIFGSESVPEVVKKMLVKTL